MSMRFTSPEVSNTQAQAIGSLFGNELFSDFSIFCGDIEFKAHKAVLYGQSKYFAAACGSQFKEGQENRLRFDQEKPFIVEAMLKYIYTREYVYPEDHEKDISRLEFHTRLYALAQMVMLDDLQHEAAHKYLQESDYWQSDIFEPICITYGTPLGSEMKEAILDNLDNIFLDNMWDDDWMDLLKEAVHKYPMFGIDLAVFTKRECNREQSRRFRLLDGVSCASNRDEKKKTFATCNGCGGQWSFDPDYYKVK